ncbi:hypothetical protein AK812_SmicGene3408 [Symbiodinium microadriaticum]|uniref:Uncharacterized protein n=1 Tax=Symbiodinium microadriaticum TaxID=2951 RepID=A0A1Q9EZ52_SYMMI|nr:hypothetical protein AK812_SmicGene3408 [Symbiodinium microadriaticum]
MGRDGACRRIKPWRDVTKATRVNLSSRVNEKPRDAVTMYNRPRKAGEARYSRSPWPLELCKAGNGGVETPDRNPKRFAAPKHARTAVLGTWLRSSAFTQSSAAKSSRAQLSATFGAESRLKDVVEQPGNEVMLADSDVALEVPAQTVVQGRLQRGERAAVKESKADHRDAKAENRKCRGGLHVLPPGSRANIETLPTGSGEHNHVGDAGRTEMTTETTQTTTTAARRVTESFDDDDGGDDDGEGSDDGGDDDDNDRRRRGGDDARTTSGDWGARDEDDGRQSASARLADATRHSSLEQMSERRTRAQKGTDVFGGDTATTTRRGDDDHVAAKRPKFQTWVRIRYFRALSILGPMARGAYPAADEQQLTSYFRAADEQLAERASEQLPSPASLDPRQASQLCRLPLVESSPPSVKDVFLTRSGAHSTRGVAIGLDPQLPSPASIPGSSTARQRASKQLRSPFTPTDLRAYARVAPQQLQSAAPPRRIDRPSKYPMSQNQACSYQSGS